MRALVTTGDGTFELQTVEIPRPGPSEVLIEVKAAAGNHTDWKTLSSHPRAGNVMGADFSGVVVSLGAGVRGREIGQRVAGCVRGNTTPNGSFAQYLCTDSKLLVDLPDHVSFEEGAQLGVSIYAACLSLFDLLKLPPPTTTAADGQSVPPNEILVWSGTSVTGYYAIQLAKLAGLRVISTSSPSHFHQVKASGADLVFDYSDSFTPRRIYAATEGRLKLAVDCVSQGMTPAQVSHCLSEEGGKIATVLPYKSRKKGVETELVWVYSMWGEETQQPLYYPACPERYEAAVGYSKMVSELLAQKKLTVGPIKVFPKGLASVTAGLEQMKAGKVSAEKFIYRISDTPGL
ncbi:dehydrogenase [Coprinopsis cinerea okayama7|uniref:Dehydrogenase n=1 Tax=Coprinopsis cinerea (strain Okayama-7 / 130 / ATCC MYA-4618 / FGSC 9003) TaxID=240176 RepID=A8NLN4_COPC7|nr:dehydrogenase [Coprinopsis cinerea okayama7\|eukprot:XP_001834735.2 dehydrogenase [Coprinopsis cinerea okayama7\